MKYALIALGALLLGFFAVLFIRAARFRPRALPVTEVGEERFDKDAAVASLAALIRCRTVSSHDPALEDEGEFERLVALLPTLYPHIMAACTLTRFDGRGLLFRWKGEGEGSPAVMMSHYDVVPVDEEGWDKPPFEGIVEDGVLWGRGAVDTKATLNAVLSAADCLVKDGFTPKCDVYFAFSGSEEVDGVGARRIVDYFEEQKIAPALVLDEGGAVVTDVFPGVTQPCAMIGIAEKGKVDMLYTAKSNGGHASAPKPHTPVGVLSAACTRIEGHPFPARLTPPVRQMFDTLGRHSTLLYRLIFANLWCFGWVLDMLGKKQGGEMNALLRTTVAFTCMEGSSAANVIPPKATMVSNIRINPADSLSSVEAYLKRTVKDESVSLTPFYGVEPSRISRTDVEGYRRVADAVAATWQGTAVTPYLMMQCSDSRYWGRISDRVYRFSALDLTRGERAAVHGHNERIRVEAIHRSVEFYLRLLRSC